MFFVFYILKMVFVIIIIIILFSFFFSMTIGLPITLRVMNKIKIALVIRIPRIKASRDAAMNIRFSMIGI